MSKSFCWTLNNYTAEEIQVIKDLCPIKANYVVFGKEIGEECRTPHLQGYIELNNIMKLTTLKNIIGKRCHIELRSGSQKDAVNYCKKGMQPKDEWKACKEKGETFGLKADVYEAGALSIKNQGKRTDIDKCRSLAKVGGMRAVTKKATSLQSIKVAEKFLEFNENKRTWKPTVYWIWGDSGTGKSHKARELCSCPKETFTKNDGSKWWIGYDAHDNVIIDDFRDNWWSITEMLSILDKYEKRIETKGGSRQLLAKTIVITSIQHPKDCYSLMSNEPITQLLRRIDHIIHLTEVWKPNCAPLTEFFTVEEVAVEEVEGNTKSSTSLIEQIELEHYVPPTYEYNKVNFDFKDVFESKY